MSSSLYRQFFRASNEPKFYFNYYKYKYNTYVRAFAYVGQLRYVHVSVLTAQE